MRDSDDIKKQRNEASKELKELKEKFETELEKDGGNGCRVHHSPLTHNHSRDSAIDADLQVFFLSILIYLIMMSELHFIIFIGMGIRNIGSRSEWNSV